MWQISMHCTYTCQGAMIDCRLRQPLRCFLFVCFCNIWNAPECYVNWFCACVLEEGAKNIQHEWKSEAKNACFCVHVLRETESQRDPAIKGINVSPRRAKVFRGGIMGIGTGVHDCCMPEGSLCECLPHHKMQHEPYWLQCDCNSGGGDRITLKVSL